MKRIAVAALALALATTADAKACATTPLEAAERFVRAQASCDFIAAWQMLAASERTAAQSAAGWTADQQSEAADALGCHAVVGDIEVRPMEGERHVISFAISEPVAVLEFRKLLEHRLTASVLQWGALDATISTTRSQLILRDQWEPRSTSISADELSVVPEHGAWCVDAGVEKEAERRRLAAEQREREAREQAERHRLAAEQREREAREQAEGRERGAAALSQVAVEAVRVGDTVLREPGVWAEVVNRSRETLRAVRVRIDMLDGDGKVIAEQPFPVILAPSRYGPVGDAARPLPPGQRRTFGVKLSDAPSTWARRVQIAVLEVEVDPKIPPRDPPAPQPRPQGARPQRAR